MQAEDLSSSLPLLKILQPLLQGLSLRFNTLHIKVNMLRMPTEW